jgi:hypothetical protein
VQKLLVREPGAISVGQMLTELPGPRREGEEPCDHICRTASRKRHDDCDGRDGYVSAPTNIGHIDADPTAILMKFRRFMFYSSRN